MMETHPRDIKGMRGSWFANAHGYEEYLPIMWSYEYNGKTHILETGWMGNAEIQISKRDGFRKFFQENIVKQCCKDNNIYYTILRYSIVQGARQSFFNSYS